MSDYTCPNCRGGFPAWNQMKCPWCETAIDGSYEVEPVRKESIVRTERKEPESFLKKLLGDTQ